MDYPTPQHAGAALVSHRIAGAACMEACLENSCRPLALDNLVHHQDRHSLPCTVDAGPGLH